MLQEWLTQITEKDELRRLLQGIEFKGSTIIFDHPEFTRALIRTAKKLDPTEYDYWNYNIADTAGPTVRGFTNGLLDKEYRYYGEAAIQAASRCADDPELRTFYDAITEREQKQATWHVRDAAFEEE